MQCISPYNLKARHRQKQGFNTETVPCGKCPTCKQRKASAWAFRLAQEYRISTTSAFITLTYSDDNVPVTEYGELTLKYRDLQNFIKQLRKLSTRKLRYYAVSEYGTKTQRPHYHIIMFNLPKGLVETVNMETAWNKGMIHIGTVTGASIGYVTNYLQKSIDHKNTDRQREKSSMSKGIGRNFLTKETIEFYRKNLLPYIIWKGGKKIPMPRYYREKIYSKTEQRTIQLLTQKYIESEYKENFAHQVEVKKSIIDKQYRKHIRERQVI